MFLAIQFISLVTKTLFLRLFHKYSSNRLGTCQELIEEFSYIYFTLSTLDKGLDSIKTGFLLTLLFYDSWVYKSVELEF